MDGWGDKFGIKRLKGSKEGWMSVEGEGGRVGRDSEQVKDEGREG